MSFLHPNPTPYIYTGHIVLHGKNSDYGPSVRLTEPIVALDVTQYHNYWKTPEGVFRRSVNYWPGSPYGFERVLPCHLNRWGMQDAG